MTESGIDRLLIVRPEDRQPYWNGTSQITIQAEAADTGGHYGLIVSHAPAGASPPLHTHGEDEAVWVAEGQVRFRCGDREFTLGPGSYTLLPRGVPHSFRVEGDTGAAVAGPEPAPARPGADHPGQRQVRERARRAAVDGGLIKVRDRLLASAPCVP